MVFGGREDGFDNLWSIASRIPGYITRNEGRVLYGLSKNQSPLGNIIEIGPYFGRSTFLLAMGIRHASPSSSLVSIDDFSKQESNTFPEAQNPEKGLRDMLQQNNLSDIVTVISGNSENVLLRIPTKSASLIFIDGLHTADQLHLEFEQAKRMLQNNGALIIHDYNNPAVDRAYSQWIHSNIVLKHPSIYILDSTPEYQGNGMLIVPRLVTHESL